MGECKGWNAELLGADNKIKALNQGCFDRKIVRSSALKAKYCSKGQGLRAKRGLVFFGGVTSVDWNLQVKISKY